MDCPDRGTWRTWLDAEADDAVALTAHLARCAPCRILIEELRADAAVAATALRLLEPRTHPSPATIALARARLAAARGTPAPTAATLAPARAIAAAPAFTPAPSAPRSARLPESRTTRRRTMTLALPLQRLRVAIGGLAAALVLMLVAGTPQGRTAAAQFLAQFRGERFAAVPLDAVQLQSVEAALTELERLGAVQGVADPSLALREVATVDEAARLAGFPVKQPDPATLPSGINPTPAEIRVIPAGEVRFTFDQAKARAYYASTGRANVRLPERFDGASLVVQTPPAVLLVYRGAGASTDPAGGIGLLVGQAGEVTAGVQGNVTLEEMREFLLSLPGLSPETERQLRAIQDWRSALPLPIPVDEVNWDRTTIAGAAGLILNDNSGLGSAALWQRDGRIYGVAGAAKAREIQRIAEGLR